MVIPRDSAALSRNDAYATCALLSKYFSSAGVNGRLSESTSANRPLEIVSLLKPMRS